MLAPMPRDRATRAAALVVFRFMRKVWGPQAAYALTRLRYGPTPAARLAAALTLARFRVPRSGAAPSMAFPGLPLTPSNKES